MTLRMGDGPVANLPSGLDAYAGYVNVSGIGITYPQVVAKFPAALHLSITTDGAAALCADVESGAMSNWTGYPYGYCAVSNANHLVSQYGRPPKLWTAHYDPRLGPHICSPACWPSLVTSADGTQWTDHNGSWDESLLLDDFFILSPTPIPGGDMLVAYTSSGNGYWLVKSDGSVYAYGDAQYRQGINNVGPNGTSVLVSGDYPTAIAGHGTDGYLISTYKNELYAFGSAKFMGKP